MALSSCEECTALYREMLDLIELSRRDNPGPGATPHDLVAWFERREENEDYKTRVRPALWNAVRKLIHHQKLAGHFVLRPLLRGGLNNPN